MLTIRTDLAVEARELKGTGKLEGIRESQDNRNGVEVETVEVLDNRGAEAIGKPVGKYVTLTPERNFARTPEAFENAAQVLAECLRMLMGGVNGTVLVVGLGNSAITPDNLGPLTVKKTLVTRHLVDAAPQHFGSFRRVAALETGVLGSTGIESAEIIRAVTEDIRPDAVIAVDALASRRLSRVCTTVQLTDTGITPGSGVGNARSELSRETLGIPVIAAGVPTVVDAATLCADLMESGGMEAPDPKILSEYGGEIVTPRDIDARIADMSRLLAAAVNLALHENLTLADVDVLMN